MCHEASGRGLQASIGTGKGTCDLADWDVADLIFVMGVNAASNAPRMLTTLAEAYRRGAEIVHVNPLVEAGARSTIIPHEFVKMATMRATPVGTLNVQPRVAGDLAFLRGVAKAVLERAAADPDVLDRTFLERNTTGFEAYQALVAATSWDDLVHESGVSEEQMRDVARRYLASSATIISWCLGVSQQEQGVDTVREIVNLLALRGNMGREGAGPAGARAQQRAGQPDVRHRPPPDRGVPRPPRRGLRDHVPPRARAGHDRGDARGGREGLREHGRQLRARGPGHRVHGCRAAVVRAHRAGLDQAQSQPSRARHRRADPSVPRALGARRAEGGAAERQRRGRDGDGPPLQGPQGPDLAGAAVRARDHRRHGRGRAPRLADAVGVVRRGLRPRPHDDGAGARPLRGLQPPRAPPARLPHPPTRARARVPHSVQPPRVRRFAAGVGCPWRRATDAHHGAVARPVEHDHLLQ